MRDNKRNFNNRNAPREKKEFDERVLDVARVARVVAGGKRFRFRATVAIGNRNGMVGVGIGKGADVAQAVAKATHQAKKHLVKVPIVKNTIPFEIKIKYNAAIIYLKPAPPGRGINAGGAVRVMAELAGIHDIIGKILSRSNNKINNARATLKAFQIMAEKTK